MSNPEDLPYRPCVGIALFNKEGLVFVGERIDTPGAWQMPQGGIDEGESLEQAAIRELFEETGTDKAEIIRIAEETICYDLPEDLRKTLWDARFRGQEQQWIAMRFTGEDSDININQHAHPEFSDWQWIKLEEAADFIVPFKRDVYKRIAELFQDV